MPTLKTAEAVGRSSLDLIPKCVGDLFWCPHLYPTAEDFLVSKSSRKNYVLMYAGAFEGNFWGRCSSGSFGSYH